MNEYIEIVGGGAIPGLWALSQEESCNSAECGYGILAGLVIAFIVTLAVLRK